VFLANTESISGKIKANRVWLGVPTLFEKYR